MVYTINNYNINLVKINTNVLTTCVWFKIDWPTVKFYNIDIERIK